MEVSEYLCSKIASDSYTPQQVRSKAHKIFGIIYFKLILIEAVHRYYESRRRVLFTDKRPERVETVKKNKRKTRTTQGQRRVCLAILCIFYSIFIS